MLDNFYSSIEENEDERVPIIANNYRPSIVGRIRTYSNIQKIEWVFILLSAVIIAISIGFTLYRILTTDHGSDLFIFAILVIINLIFTTYYLLHGILQEQPFEILTYIFSTIVIACLVTINFASSEKENFNIRMVRFIVTILLTIPNVVIAGKIGKEYWESGPFVFKTVGGDMRLQRMCRTYLFGSSLLIFNAQAAISCIILVMRNGFSGIVNEEIVILFAGTIFILMWLMIGYVGMRTENIRVTWLFAVISIVQPLYVLYLFVQCIDQIKQPYNIRTNSAFFAGGILLLSHFTLLTILCQIASNYGKGLKEAIYGDDSSTSRNSQCQDSIEPNDPENYDAILPAAD